MSSSSSGSSSKLRLFDTDRTIDDSRLTEKLRDFIDHPSWTELDGDRDEAECRRLLNAATWSSSTTTETNASAPLQAPMTSEQRDATATHVQNNHAGELADGSDVDSGDDVLLSRNHPSSNAMPRFQLGEKIGQGGFGIVFRVHDCQLDRLAAVKMLRPSVVHRPSILRRFLREAKAVQSLSHPGVITIYDVGAVEGHPFIVTELIDGPNMAKWLKEIEHPQPARQSAQMLREIAEAVHYAHSRGILHRDLKPSNILLHLLTDEDGSSRVETKLTDFGLAKPLEETIDSVRDLTHVRELVGTVRYMSPEQATGRSNEVAITSDIFSLGGILYELLTGEHPFYGTTDAETIHRICNVEPKRPRQLNRAIPRDLEAIALQCLEKKPEKRYATAAELVADLNRYLEGYPVEAAHPSPARRAWASLRAHPYRTAVGAMMLSLLLSFFVYSEVMSAREREQQRRADDNLRLAIEGIGRTLNMLSEQINAGIPISHAMHMKILETSRQFHQRLAERNPHDLYALYRLSVTHHYAANGRARLGEFASAVEERRSALAILDRLLQLDPDNVDYHFDKFMQNLLISGELKRVANDASSPDAGRAMEIANEHIARVLELAPDDVDYRNASISFRYNFALQRPFEEAKSILLDVILQSKAMYESHTDQAHFLKPAVQSYAFLCSIANREQDYSATIRYATQALDLADETFPEETRDGAIWHHCMGAHFALAYAYSQMSEWAAADESAQEAIRCASIATNHEAVSTEVLLDFWKIRAKANEQLGRDDIAAQCNAEVENLAKATANE